MAEIQIVYREGFCGYYAEYYGWHNVFSLQCYTVCAGDVGCRGYSDGGKRYDDDGIEIIPTGDCVYACWKYKYKGWSGKNYEIEELHDPYNPQLDCMRVKLGRTEYDCVKVILNGECIYNDYDGNN